MDSILFILFKTFVHQKTSVVQMRTLSEGRRLTSFGQPKPAWDVLSDVKSEVGMRRGITAVARSLLLTVSELRNLEV